MTGQRDDKGWERQRDVDKTTARKDEMKQGDDDEMDSVLQGSGYPQGFFQGFSGVRVRV